MCVCVCVLTERIVIHRHLARVQGGAERINLVVLHWCYTGVTVVLQTHKI
jgi:hypothetical protein